MAMHEHPHDLLHEHPHDWDRAETGHAPEGHCHDGYAPESEPEHEPEPEYESRIDHATANHAGQAVRSAAAQPFNDGGELVRFSVAVPEGLLRAFDAQTVRRGDSGNRSEAIRDLIRASLVREAERQPDAHVIGSLTMIYDHHTGDLTRRLDEIQHNYTSEIVSTMHVHLDHHNCLEILALNGKGSRIYELSDKLLGLRGVKHGELTCAATESELAL